MELKKYFLPLIRWWWLLLVATLVAGVFSFLANLQQPPIYQARTTLMIGNTIQNPNPSGDEFWLSQQLAATYADIGNRELVQRATMEALGLQWLPEYRARALPNSQLIEIVVVDTVPERAQAVANELANQLILRSPTSVQAGEKNRQEFVNSQLNTLEIQIDQTAEEIARYQEDLGDMVSARQIQDTQNQIAVLEAKLTSLQENYANLLGNTQGGAINTLSVIEPAALPTQPMGPSRMISVLLAAAIGFGLAAGAAYLLEYLDDTLRTPEDVERVAGAPVYGYIADMDDVKDSKLFVAENPRHPVVEAFRSLRTNLEFAGVDQPIKTLFVASADTQEGKTSIASNLAVVMAQGEKKVILVDADLRRPRVHEFFGLENTMGLSDVFVGRLPIESVLKSYGQENRVTVITAGTRPPNPTELLGSKRMDQILARLSEMADITIIDGPPFLVADAAVLAAKSDGVLVVVRPGFTKQASARAMIEQIKRAGARIVGVALNRIPKKQSYYYGNIRYLSPYYAEDDFDDVTQPIKTGKLWQKWPNQYKTGTAENVKEVRVVRGFESPKKPSK